jgi:hypothetical protein
MFCFVTTSGSLLDGWMEWMMEMRFNIVTARRGGRFIHKISQIDERISNCVRFSQSRLCREEGTKSPPLHFNTSIGRSIRDSLSKPFTHKKQRHKMGPSCGWAAQRHHIKHKSSTIPYISIIATNITTTIHTLNTTIHSNTHSLTNCKSSPFLYATINKLLKWQRKRS